MRWARHVAHKGERKGYTRFWSGNQRERDNLEDPGVDGRIILRLIIRKWDVGGMDYNDLAEDKDCWRAVVNAVINLRVP